jgi:hypothetical protein
MKEFTGKIIQTPNVRILADLRVLRLQTIFNSRKDILPLNPNIGRFGAILGFIAPELGLCTNGVIRSPSQFNLVVQRFAGKEQVEVVLKRS